jgi:hypothetical protein
MVAQIQAETAVQTPVAAAELPIAQVVLLVQVAQVL